MTPLGGRVAIGGVTPPGTDGVIPLGGGSVAIGGDAPPGRAGTAGRSGVTPVGGNVAIGGDTPPGTVGVTPLGGSVAIGGVTPPGTDGVIPLGGGSAAIGGDAPPGRAGTAGRPGVTPVGGNAAMGGAIPPGTVGVTPLGGSVAIGGVTPPGTVGVSPLGGKVAIGGATPPGTVGMTPLGGSAAIGGATPPGTVGVIPLGGGRVAIGGNALPGSAGNPSDFRLLANEYSRDHRALTVAPRLPSARRGRSAMNTSPSPQPRLACRRSAGSSRTSLRSSASVVVFAALPMTGPRCPAVTVVATAKSATTVITTGGSGSLPRISWLAASSQLARIDANALICNEKVVSQRGLTVSRGGLRLIVVSALGLEPRTP